MIRKNDLVTFRPEWMDDGDDEITFMAMEDEDGGRILVCALLDLPFNPNQVVTRDMIATVNGAAL